MTSTPANSHARPLLISKADNLAILQEIFFDALLLDYNFKIQSIGLSVTNDLSFSVDELKGKSIELLIPDFLLQVVPLLEAGYFAQKKFNLKTKWSDSIAVNLSGFYTGLLTDINGFIILRYENLEEVMATKRKLEAKVKEMDHFIYQASHSLRGPLATIKGLINITKVEQDPEKLAFVYQQMEEFANRLDTKLYKLMCFAEADSTIGIPTGVINETKLQEELNQLGEHEGSTVVISCKVNAMKGLLVNEHLIKSIAINLTSFIITAEIKVTAHLGVSITGSLTSIMLEFVFSGIDIDAAFQNVLIGEHGYGHLLEQPNLTNIYSVKKIIFGLQGKIISALTDQHCGNIKVTIPYNFISLSRD